MAHPARAAVIGSPIAHSLSPALHRAANEALGMHAEYTAIEVTEATFPAFLASIRAEPENHWLGLSVTMPLKRLAAEAASWQDENTRLIGVANTLTFDADPSSSTQLTVSATSVGDLESSVGNVASLNGQVRAQPGVRAHNTDIPGIVNALRHAGVTKVDSALILGGGGTALAALAAFVEMGATTVEVALRDVTKTGDLVRLTERLGIKLHPAQLQPAKPTDTTLASTAEGEQTAQSGGHDVVLSALPPRAADPLADHLPANPGVLLDVAYDPWPSKLASAFEEAGGTVISGKEMLVYQALEQVRLFWQLGSQLPERVINAMCDAAGIPRR